jgi:regulator of RNase E activity RraA
VNPEGLPPTTALADVLLIRGFRGVLSPPLTSFTTLDQRVTGRARTLRLARAEPPLGSLERLYTLLDEDLTGGVVVVVGAEAIEAAVWGQILSRAARRAGAAAAIVGGAVRDRVALTGEGLPVWGQIERTVGAVGMAQVVAVDETVTIGEATIEPGDTVVVDDLGAVALPEKHADDLLAGANDLTAGEEALLTELASNTKLARAYEHKRRAVQRIRDG